MSGLQVRTDDETHKRLKTLAAQLGPMLGRPVPLAEALRGMLTVAEIEIVNVAEALRQAERGAATGADHPDGATP